MTDVQPSTNNEGSGKKAHRSKWCFVLGCENSSTTTSNKIFFTAPKNPEIRKRWFDAGKLKNHPSPLSQVYACEDHFDLQKDTVNFLEHQLTGRKLRLQKDVLPRIFHSQGTGRKQFKAESSMRKRFKKIETPEIKLEPMDSPSTEEGGLLIAPKEEPTFVVDIDIGEEIIEKTVKIEADTVKCISSEIALVTPKKEPVFVNDFDLGEEVMEGTLESKCNYSKDITTSDVFSTRNLAAQMKPEPADCGSEGNLFFTRKKEFQTIDEDLRKDFKLSSSLAAPVGNPAVEDPSTSKLFVLKREPEPVDDSIEIGEEVIEGVAFSTIKMPKTEPERAEDTITEEVMIFERHVKQARKDFSCQCSIAPDYISKEVQAQPSTRDVAVQVSLPKLSKRRFPYPDRLGKTKKRKRKVDEAVIKHQVEPRRNVGEVAMPKLSITSQITYPAILANAMKRKIEMRNETQLKMKNEQQY